MKKMLCVAAAAAAVSATPAFAGVSLTTTPNASAAPAGYSTVINFNSQPGSTTIEANSKGFSVDYAGDASRMDQTGVSPYSGTPSYLFVAPSPQDGGFFGVGGISDGVQSSVTFMGINALTSLSVFIGSLDSYNTIDLLDQAGKSIGTFTGTQINGGRAPGYPGDVTPINTRATFTGTDGQTFYGAKFYNNNGQGSFEFDNLAFTAAVPEPGTWAMMILGFGMVGGAARYRRRSTKMAYA